MYLSIVKMYSKIYEFMHDNFSVNIRGLGFLLRKLNNDSLISMSNGGIIYLNSNVSSSYSVIIGGGWAEKETHLFINKIIDNNTIFIDVGANIGEMILDFQKANRCYAFEPSFECYKVLQVNKIINNQHTTTIENIALSNTIGEMYLLNDGTPQASLSCTDNKDSTPVKVLTMDIYFENIIHDFFSKTIILLIDVEGHEPNVLKGGVDFIQRTNPIIVFEYNSTSKEFFNLDDIYKILPKNYEIFRLNQDGKLDLDFSSTWNCVAIPSTNKSKVKNLIIKENII